MYCGPLNSIERRQIPGIDMKGGYVAERKYDGMWCAWHVDHAGSSDHRFESRTGLDCDGSDIDGLQGIDMGPVGRGTVLIGELEAASELATKSYKQLGHRRFFVYDVAIYQGIDLRGRPYRERQAVLRKQIWYAIPRTHQRKVVLAEQVFDGFLPFYDRILSEGGEGIVLKPLDLAARPTRADGKTPEWLRVKPWRTVDYIVVGPARTEKGELSAKLGLWGNGKPRVVLQCSLPDLELDESGEKLVQEGQVVELYGRELFDSGAIRHAVFRRWRKDKTPEMCTGEPVVLGEV